jgi:curved DNA-binding protein CbpA
MNAADPRKEDLRRLGLSPQATWEEVEAGYRRLALSLHPDVNPTRTAAERFRQATAAYQRLSMLRKERKADAEEDPRTSSLPPQELALRLRYSSSARVRAVAASLLGRAEGKETRRALLAALRDPEGQVRAAALDALGGVGRPADLPALLAEACAVRGATARATCRCMVRILLRIFGK